MIPTKLYKQIVESMPLLCVDVILTINGQFILVQRANEPLKGEWWVVGGRVLKNETLLECAERKVREEIGLLPMNLEMVGIYEDSYPKSEFGVPTQSVSIVFTGEINEYSPKLDATSVDIKLSDNLPKRFLQNLK